MKPVNVKRFWFYDDWDGGWEKASDEYGHHTVVIPFGKGRAVVIAYRRGFGKFRFCEFCALARVQTLETEQDMCYIQTYWGLDDYDDVYELPNEQWDEALGVLRETY